MRLLTHRAAVDNVDDAQLRSVAAGLCVALSGRMGGRILIVEDEAILRKHLARLFVREGFEVTTAGSCAEALDHLARGGFEALLLDVMLPDGDGLDLLAGLGERQPRQTVVMTAFSTPENERRVQRLTDCHVLRKPLDLLQVIGVIRLGSNNRVRVVPNRIGATTRG